MTLAPGDLAEPSPGGRRYHRSQSSRASILRATSSGAQPSVSTRCTAASASSRNAAEDFPTPDAPPITSSCESLIATGCRTSGEGGEGGDLPRTRHRRFCSNENTNRLLRQHLPAQVDLSYLTQAELDAVAGMTIGRPLRVLEWKTSLDLVAPAPRHSFLY